MELGAELVKQLGDAADRNLLVRWMAEHLAGLMARHRKTTGAEKARLAKECSEIILKIWTHRHHLPDGARPLEQFEPLFNVIAQLESGEVRHPIIRLFVDGKAIGAGSKMLKAAVAIDKASSSLIRYCLGEMTAKLAKKDKRFVELAKTLGLRDRDMEILFVAHANSETLVQKKERMKKRELEDIQSMIANLELVDKQAAAVRAHLEAKLKAAKKSK